jgi:RNA polymerase sigma factor (sigma-70 family)
MGGPPMSSSGQENHGRAARATEARSLGIPFLDVAINPTILDGKGERMSKSKGNGVDPLDIIFSHGADALRFTLTNMATETQDARMPVQVVCPHCGQRLPNPDNKDTLLTCGKCKKKLTRPINNATGSDDAPLARMTSDRFDLGRNFCNKLWNACRFALSNLEAHSTRSGPAVGSALADAGFPPSRNVARIEAPPATSASAKADPTLVREKPDPTSSDEVLMQRTQQGDQMAFALLYERYAATVITQLRELLGDAEEIEFLGQEVFLRAYRFAATFQYPNKFSTWLLTIARNVATNQSSLRRARAAQLNMKGIDMSGDPREVAARATDNLKKQEETTGVLEALHSLPNDQKEVIVLGIFQDLSSEQMQESVDTAPAMTLADRWIISRFHRAVKESNDALAAYRFDVYAKACYDFFWRDFCDWYVEAIKPAMKDPARAPQTANVLAAVLDGALRLMHPMIPFITETIWWRLNEVRPVRGLAGLLECPVSKRLVLAHWPSKTPVLRYSEEPGSSASDAAHRNVVGSASADAATPASPTASAKADPTGAGSNDPESLFFKLQEIIVAIRTIRNDYQVNPKQAVNVSLKAPAQLAGQMEANRELIELLATTSLKAISASLAPVPNAVTASAGGAEIFVEGLIDAGAEKGRLTKDLETKEKSVAALKGRLSNEAYIAKAPPKLVQDTKDQLAAADAEVAKLKEAIGKL